MGDVDGPTQPASETTFFERVGGHETFAALIHAFFEGIRADPELHALYPADDLPGAEHRLLMFFEQYWGGPPTYSRTRGAPRLRMRHMPYKITPRMKDAWLRAMHDAITAVDLVAEDEFLMRDYVERAAAYLINADE